jgi:putative nucleotidyltransferase with HDIG domain
MGQEIPGTYSHSLVLSNMADAAAEAIGANGLLAKVGAMYHDIGKMHKPDYFVENQQAGINRHRDLSPSMSLMIIRGHVKDGIEIAREYGLPRVLWQFIEEHHGTTLVKYFLKVASDQQSSKASGKHDRAVPESEFRYPGPRPRTRESAILMLCDGAEGAVRALEEPTAARIESTVHRLVMDRLTDGQFDRCTITMSELKTVEETLVKVLRSIYHGRIAYPKEDKEEKEATQQPEPELQEEAETPEPPESVAPQTVHQQKVRKPA